MQNAKFLHYSIGIRRDPNSNEKKKRNNIWNEGTRARVELRSKRLSIAL